MKHIPTSAYSSLVALAASAAPALAQAGATSIGTGCPGASGATPEVFLGSLPYEGNSFQLGVEGLPGATGVIIIGLSVDIWSGVPLPIDLTPFGFSGCELYTDFRFAIPYATDGDGIYTASGSSPKADATFYAQAWINDSDATVFGGWSPALCITGGAGPAAGALVISEVMANPDFLLQQNGEWFEVFNPGPFGIDIEGWTLADDGGSHVVDVGGAGLIVPAGGHLVLGRKDDPALTGGVAVDYAYFGDVVLGNTADQITLTAFDGTLVDTVAYDAALGFPVLKGASMSLDPANLDAATNDLPTSWCSASSPIGAEGNTDLATPGALNDCCGTGSTPGDVIITEILSNPAFTLQQNGEWFEVFNTTNFSIDLQGWTIEDDGGTHTIDAGPGGLPIGPGQYLVLGRKDDPGLTGGVEVDYRYFGDIILGNGSDFLRLTSCEGTFVDEVAWDGGATFPNTAGRSMSLDPALFDGADNDFGTSWCDSSTPIGGPAGNTDLATPGADNDPCGLTPSATAGDLVITEILMAPSAVPHNLGEYVEVFNPGASDVDLEGWTLADDLGSHVIDNGGAGVIVPAGGYALLTRNGDSSQNGGLSSTYTYGNDIKLQQTDVVSLSAGATLVDAVAYDTGFPVQGGSSMSLDPESLDAVANDDAANWCDGSTLYAGSAGDLGTPGEANDPCGPLDLTGQWALSFETTAASAYCFEDIGEQSNHVADTTQVGDAVTLTIAGLGTFSGTLTGNVLNITGTIFEPGGTTTITGSDIVVDASGDQLSGSLFWSYVDGGGSCTAVDTVFGTRL